LKTRKNTISPNGHKASSVKYMAAIQQPSVAVGVEAKDILSAFASHLTLFMAIVVVENALLRTPYRRT
jgi:hypothetical protein